MQGIYRLFIMLYAAVSLFILLASVIMFSFVAFVALVNGRSSSERTLIGVGAALHAMSLILGIVISLLLQFNLLGGLREYILIPISFSYLISSAGLAMGLYGVIKLLRRAAQMELLLQDPEDDR